ncbi:DUF6588 family protein [Mucilaginibacter arboris]|uniref:Outer membrane protein beta-barrel domain-containing protein n=1 Tax=Mucilaginibacter arboris TaxID=2682090 RepID=A0A7K1SU69_9SPHI|nr:DUF6588 family protein [Mucilaginibacter arboris]MVN20882.1 hypothetical protein [Mucilaginibacter arboris]
MNKFSKTLITAGMLLLGTQLQAQDYISALIKSGPADATKLANAYLEPLFKGFGTGINSGWNNTAKTKSLLGFDLRASVSAVFTPSSDKTFDITKIGLSNNVRPTDASRTIAPTIGGSGAAPQIAVYDDQNRKVGNFTLPSGVLSVIPAPQIQLTAGLVYHTEASLRYMPSINFGSNVGSISMIGFGLKHNILQDFVGKTADKIIPIDLAISAGFTQLKYHLPVSVQPDQGVQPKDNQQNTDFSNQRVDGTFNGFNAEVIVSKKILFFTPFASVGYLSSHTNVGLLGNFPITTGINNIVQQQPTYTTFTDPVSIKEQSISSAKATLGFELNLAFFRFYAAYTTSQYQSVNAGIGFGL